MSGQPPVRAIAVVIPARNEEALLGACLESVSVTAARVGLPTVIALVLDRCSDGSAAVAHSYRSVMPLLLVEGIFPGIGCVRDAGVAHARHHFASMPAASVWVANTDADTVVPDNWLEQQRNQADTGLDLLLGTVEPDPALPGQEHARALWFSEHDLRDGHGHVHGANLGIRLSELDRVGGFGEARVGEDAGVAVRVQSSNDRWCATDSTRVVTSSRRQGRAEHGFAEYLRELDASIADGISGAKIRR